MQRGDVSIISSALHHAMKTLRMRWDETHEVWDDSVSRKFEEEYLVPLEPQLQVTLKAINRLSLVMARAHEECS
jgi:hypothetical protein